MCMPGRIWWAVSPLAFLAGCGHAKPEGQVIATVNGQEITRPELNAALPNRGEVSGKNAARIRNVALDQVIMQQLVAQEARRQGLDKSQDYLLASKRADAQILAELLSRRVVQQLRQPYAQNVEQFVKTNPGRFADRQVLAVEQIRFSAATFDPQKLKDVHSLDAAAALLTQAKVPFERGRVAVDTLNLDADALRQLKALPPGEPFLSTAGTTAILSNIVGRQPAALEGEVAQRAGLEVLRQMAARAALAKQLEALRQKAQIDYQPGFGPSKPPASGAVKPAG